MMLYVNVTYVHCLSITFPVPGIQKRQENQLIVSILDNSDDLNSVHCFAFAIRVYV